MAGSVRALRDAKCAARIYRSLPYDRIRKAVSLPAANDIAIRHATPAVVQQGFRAAPAYAGEERGSQIAESDLYRQPASKRAALLDLQRPAGCGQGYAGTVQHRTAFHARRFYRHGSGHRLLYGSPDLRPLLQIPSPEEILTCRSHYPEGTPRTEAR